MSARLARLTVATVCLGTGALGLTGCGPAGTDHPAPSGSPTVQATARGPLDALLLQLGGGDPLESDDPVAAAVEQQRVREERVAACMVAAGFEYTPQVPAASDVKVMTGPTRGTREYVERYGYGAADAPREEGGGIEWSITGADTSYVDSLSELGRAAYDEALWGPVTETGADGSVTRAGGCQDRAYSASPEADAFAALQTEASEFLAALGDDPAFAELDTAWSRCMDEQGYSYATPAAAEASFFDRSMALIDPESHVTDPAGKSALAEEELPTALADLECQERLDYRAEHATIAAGLQQEWMDLHRTELDAWVEAAATSGAPDS